MTETIGIIGSGQIGTGLAQLAIKAGYNVVIANSRGPETLKDSISNLGSKASASSTKDLVSNDAIKIIVLSIPLKNVPTLFKSLEFKNKIFVDTSNYYPLREGHLEELDSRSITTSEYVTQFLGPSNTLVKAFHNIDSIHFPLAATQDPSYQTTLPISGDDKSAKEAVTVFINKLGFQVLDIGVSKESWKIEPGTPIYGLPYIPKSPAGLDHEATKRYFLTTNAKPLTKVEAQKLVDQVKNEGKVGGDLDDLPKIWKEIVLELYSGAGRTFGR